MNKLDEMISGLPEAAKEYIKNKKLDEVECVIADLPGIARGKAVPATKFSRQKSCLLYTSPSPRDATLSRMPSSA